MFSTRSLFAVLRYAITLKLFNTVVSTYQEKYRMGQSAVKYPVKQIQRNVCVLPLIVYHLIYQK